MSCRGEMPSPEPPLPCNDTLNPWLGRPYEIDLPKGFRRDRKSWCRDGALTESTPEDWEAL